MIIKVQFFATFREIFDAKSLQIEVGPGGTVGDLLRAPLGNHLVLVKGHHLTRLQAWWEMMIHR